MLLLSPTSSGLSTGNPSVISCGLTLAAIFLALDQRLVLSTLLLGLAHAIKPQVSIAAAAILLLWGYWRIVALSFVVPVIAAVVSLLRAASFDQYRIWLGTLFHALRAVSVPGGDNDPSTANPYSYHLINTSVVWSLWLRDPQAVGIFMGVVAGALAGAYIWIRRRTQADEPLRDIAFFCPWVLTLVYHRYYDAQLLLGVVPFLLAPSVNLQKTRAALWAGLLLMTFPLQAVVADSSLHHMNPATPAGFLLLRHQPVIVLLLCILLIPWRRGIRHSEGGHDSVANAKVCNS
jgi:hypothetical protein